MTIRYYRRYKRGSGTDVFDPDGAVTFAEVETIAQRLCACTCGHRWYAEVGTTTRCEGNITRFHCPINSKPFEVPA